MNLKSPLNKICVFIISNFFISVSDAQTLVIPDSLKLYYSLINEAEMEILDSGRKKLLFFYLKNKRIGKCHVKIIR